MIINGFGNGGNGSVDNPNDWITLMSQTCTWTGAFTTSYAGEYGWLYPSGPSFIWPDLSPYRYARIHTSALSIYLNTAKTYSLSSSAVSVDWYFCFSNTQYTTLQRIESAYAGYHRTVTFTWAASKTVTPSVGVDIITNPPTNLTVSANKTRMLPILQNSNYITYTNGNTYNALNGGYLTTTGWYATTSSSSVSSVLVAGATIYWTLYARCLTSQGAVYLEGSNFTITGTFNFQVLP